MAEEAEFRALLARLGSGARVYYRRREHNHERKAGNIADWVRRWGAAWPQFIILDADSLMTGDTVVRLAATMERHDDIALIQTLPVIVRRHAFARMQQFAAAVWPGDRSGVPCGRGESNTGHTRYPHPGFAATPASRTGGPLLGGTGSATISSKPRARRGAGRCT